MLPENNKGNVVCHQLGRNPECGYPVGGAHICRCTIDCSQCYRDKQVQRSFHVENPYEQPSSAYVSMYSRKSRPEQGKRQASLRMQPDRQIAEGFQRTWLLERGTLTPGVETNVAKESVVERPWAQVLKASGKRRSWRQPRKQKY